MNIQSTEASVIEAERRGKELNIKLIDIVVFRAFHRRSWPMNGEKYYVRRTAEKDVQSMTVNN
jgi:hypothetical protein